MKPVFIEIHSNGSACFKIGTFSSYFDKCFHWERMTLHHVRLLSRSGLYHRIKLTK